MKRKHKELCYYCGAQATSREHAPSRQMFKGFECDSITVPSCDQHNTTKGGDDQAIVSAFLIPFRNDLENSSPLLELEADVLKALNIARPSFELTQRRAISTPLLNDPPKELSDWPDMAYLVPSVDIRGWIRQLTAALVYDATKTFDSTINWAEAIAWSPNWIEAVRPSPLRLEHIEFEKREKVQAWLDQLDWEEGWSATPREYPPNIYTFQLHFEPQGAIFKHSFYNRYTWYAWFGASQETLAKLKRHR